MLLSTNVEDIINVNIQYTGSIEVTFNKDLFDHESNSLFNGQKRRSGVVKGNFLHFGY